MGTLPLPPNDPRGSRLVPYYGQIAYLCQNDIQQSPL